MKYAFQFFCGTLVVLFLLPTVTFAARLDATYVLGQTTFTGNLSGATQSQFSSPTGGLYDDNNERLFVADLANHRVLVYDLSSGITNGMNATYVLGQPDFTTVTPGVTQSKMTNPQGNFVYDQTRDLLFISDGGNSRVLVYDLSSGITNGMNATYVLGQPDFTTGTGARTQSRMSTTSGLAYDPARGYLFVSDTGNSRIVVFDVSGTITNGMNASYVLGASDFTTMGSGAGTINGGDYYGIDYDTVSDILYAASFNSFYVPVFDLSSGITNGMNTSYILGAPDFATTGDTAVSLGGGITDTKWTSIPNGVLLDKENRILYVLADLVNVTLIAFNIDTISTYEDSIAVLTQNSYDYSTHEVGTTQNLLAGASGSGIGAMLDESSNRLFFPDASSNRIMVYDLIRITTTSLASGTVGTAYTQSIAYTADQGTVTLSLASGSLPDGISISGTSLTGTPTIAGTYSFTLKITDTYGDNGALFDLQSYTMTVAEAPAASVATSSSGGISAQGRYKNLVSQGKVEEAEKIVAEFPKQFPEIPTISSTTITLDLLQNRLTRLGNIGPHVKQLQNALNQKGTQPPLVPDGHFGPKTLQAVKAFQTKNGLVTDGIVGLRTVEKLQL